MKKIFFHYLVNQSGYMHCKAQTQLSNIHFFVDQGSVMKTMISNIFVEAGPVKIKKGEKCSFHKGFSKKWVHKALV